ncbi:Crp/Fnr family transcriptional regulator [Bacteroides sp. 519]|uniref:Crp/Fnr family transcriptional regulator n=1 Tax=Bacteroides sp. 519 TaxID=2302937 RepID=UPI0013D834E1|nr:Crp/Fnr family transcriptional regulator [Bacteroides sp. 519]NDV59850.1 Crp/Fnr family transcriptional regulator [Bacteroides sp. 519]
MNINLTPLTQCNLFRSLNEQEINSLFSTIPVKQQQFKKGEILAWQDEPCNRLIFLLNGSVKAEMTDPTGKIIKVEDIHAPNPLAILFLFGDNNRFPVQATANEEVTALIIPRSSVLKMLMENESLLKNYLDISANFATRLSRRLHFMSFRTIRQKVSVYILELAKEQQSDTIELRMSKSAIAEYFGVSRPSLERELTHMQQEGLIESERRRITIKEKNKLIKLINF